MQEIQAAQQTGRVAAGRSASGRWVFLGVTALALSLLVLLPPLISVNRYQHRISTSISTSLGRPVHFDQVSLNLVPLPSFTITNFVVEEDPAFGAEPIIRANSVQAVLRIGSLWRGRVEFSRISFTDPSVNLVHNSSGKWNLEGILFHAAQIETAPTNQRNAGATPRFPYIEATGARINLKYGVEKTPFSLAEADFSLWLPDPQAWRMRLKARPIRTDTSVSDTGLLQVEGTLGRAASLSAVPLDLQASWRNAPLGEASRLLFARDLGVRGDLSVVLTLNGSPSQLAIQTDVSVNRFRRSDFVPEQTLTVNLECRAKASRMLHTISDLRCGWPIPDSEGATLALAGSIPDVLQPSSADMQVGTSRLPAATLLSWLRVVSSRIPPSLKAAGLVSGSVLHDTNAAPDWSGEATIADLQLSGANLGPVPLALGGIFLRVVNRSELPISLRQTALLDHTVVATTPVSVPLGGRDPASLEGMASRTGYSLHLSGVLLPSRLLAFGAAIPQLGQGLSLVIAADRATGPSRVDLTSRRTWGGVQVWTDNLAHSTNPLVHPTGAQRNFSHRPKSPGEHSSASRERFHH